MELVIYNREDRLRVATILIDNGYKVGVGKRPKTQTGKALEYYLTVEEGGVSGESQHTRN